MWGSCCFNTGDIKITLGTGSFLNLNTGSQCPASIYGLYPLVAWRYADKQNTELVYCMEGAANDTGSIIQWAMNFGLFEDPSKSADIANSVDDTEDVYFVPAFSGLGVSYFYESICFPLNSHFYFPTMTINSFAFKPHRHVNCILCAIHLMIVATFYDAERSNSFKTEACLIDIHNYEKQKNNIVSAQAFL